MTPSLLAQGYFEFAEQMGAPIGEDAQEKIEERWKGFLANVAREFLLEYPDPAAMIGRLNQVIEESVAAGSNPITGELLGAVTDADPQRAAAFSAALLDRGCEARFANIWYQVLYRLPASQAAEIERLLALGSEHPRTDIRSGVMDYFRFRDHKGMALNPAERTLLEGMALQAGPEETKSFVKLIQWVGPSCAEWGYGLLRKLRLADLPDGFHGEVLAALNPFYARMIDPPPATVRHVLDALIKIPEIKVNHSGGAYERIVKLYPRAIYDFVLQRVARYEELGMVVRYQALPHGILARFRLEGLSMEADFDNICDFLWGKTVGSISEPSGYIWRQLFHGIVLDRVDFWLPKLTAAVKAATSLKELGALIEIIHFDGSLVVFRFPDFAKTILHRAEDLQGIEGYNQMRSTLYVVSGPQFRSGTNGELDKNVDYIEAEAIRAAATYAADSVLGPFYRWIVDVEQRDRDQNRKRYQAEIALLDEE